MGLASWNNFAAASTSLAGGSTTFDRSLKSCLSWARCFVIDHDEGTTVVAVEGASIVGWPFILFGFVFLDAASPPISIERGHLALYECSRGAQKGIMNGQYRR